MRTRQLGAGGPDISVIGYGAWQAGGADWGGRAPDDDVIAAIRAAIDSGQTWIDTAEVYGQGRSEELVGRAIAGRRDEVLLFTKVAPDDEGSGIRPDEIRSAIQGSLRRLGTDRVDLYQVHWPDERIPVEETWGVMAELVGEGLTRRIGVSNFDRALVERCLPIHPVASVQNELSLLCRDDTSGAAARGSPVRASATWRSRRSRPASSPAGSRPTRRSPTATGAATSSRPTGSPRRCRASSGWRRSPRGST